jgi:hypothetical protein
VIQAFKPQKYIEAVMELRQALSLERQPFWREKFD